MISTCPSHALLGTARVTPCCFRSDPDPGETCGPSPLILKKFILNGLKDLESVSVPDAAKLSFEVCPYLLQVVFGRQRYRSLIQLSPIVDDDPRWTLSYDVNRLATLHPSIWRIKGCRSHFFVRANEDHLGQGRPPRRRHVATRTPERTLARQNSNLTTAEMLYKFRDRRIDVGLDHVSNRNAVMGRKLLLGVFKPSAISSIS